MPTFTVHAPPPKKGEAASAAERFVFVRDGFHVWAFLLAPVWLLMHRLWLALTVYLLGYGLIEVALAMTGASQAVQFVVGLLVALLMGLEAPSLWRWKLTRRGWTMLGFVVAENAEMAERRFFAAWAKGTRAGAPAASPMPPAEPHYAAPVRRGSPTGNDVIGLFPEPGGAR
jgi:hypothetical protein